MRILAFSDIFWRSIFHQKLTKQIDEIHPDLVLLAGDLVNDMIGFNDYGKVVSRDEYWDEVYGLLYFLNERRIQTYFIRGNWDNSPEYDEIIELTGKKLHYVKEISEKIEEFETFRILGLSHAFTNNLQDLKLVSEKFQEKLDLVLAHAEYKRRTWLFHLNTKLIITGHFDRQLCQIQDKVFISLESFPRQYAVIDCESDKYKISYFDKGTHNVVLRKAIFSQGQLIWETKPFKHGKQYANEVESLMAAKIQINFDNTKRQEIVNRLLKLGIAKKHIEEYLGISLRSKIRLDER